MHARISALKTYSPKTLGSDSALEETQLILWDVILADAEGQQFSQRWTNKTLLCR